MELFNLDEIAKLAARQPYQPNHEGLLESLRERYPHADFNFIAIRGIWSSVQKGLVSAEGRKISDDFKKWVTVEYHSMGEDARAVWEKYKDTGLLMTEIQGTTLYITSPFASSPEAFIQIEFDLVHEVANRLAFDADAWTAPEDLDDLLNPLTGVSVPQEISAYQYQFNRLTNIRRFCQEMADLDRQLKLEKLPEFEKKTVRVVLADSCDKSGQLIGEFNQEIQEVPYLEMFPDWPKKELRLLQDWQESSAGRSGARLCDHWFLQLLDYTDSDGQRTMSFIPQWADGDGGEDLPEITSSDRNNAYSVMAQVEKFDAQAGYPFAWYFYMLHGNRIDYTVGETVARGLQAGKIRLAECDEKVLLRWYGREYGF